MRLTPRQTEALALIDREGVVAPRRLAGELGMRSQDAGRTLSALERAGLVEFWTGVEGGERLADAGYRRRGDHWDGDGLPEDDEALDAFSLLGFLPDEVTALYDHSREEAWVWEHLGRHEERAGEPEKAERSRRICRYWWRRAERFRALAKLNEEDLEKP